MPRSDHVDALLRYLVSVGGSARRADLQNAASSPAVRKALRLGKIRRSGHGWYSLVETVATPTRDWATWYIEKPTHEWSELRARELSTALAARACLSHRSAALAYGWPVLTTPTRIEVTVPAGRHHLARWPARRRSLSADELREGVTSPLTTVIDCARDLDFTEAVAVADSALRSDSIGQSELCAAADRLPGATAEVVRRVAYAATAKSANPFESAVRAVALDVDGVCLVPQFDVRSEGVQATVDLADEKLRIAIEADSYAYHGGREAFERDVDRYNELAVRGWTVIRARWAHIGSAAGVLRELLSAAVFTSHANSTQGLGRNRTVTPAELR